ncbi:LPS export ABC transporter permease LptG [Dryocola clanedunensis]|uniref:LPS export ABC transporter permease LptG n=1 Tax=Cedecea sulfonylureivorans TaxID=3051154 RepID=UPI0019275D99|nr:LPS export ABC transporter permease LptG [Cedecea sulfonylureivorans]
MTIFSRYLIRNVFIGFFAAAGLLIPLFTTFNLINELEDVTPHGYSWTQALLVTIMTLPRTLVDLGPFVALLGGIVGLGLLSKNSELTAIRSTGMSIFSIALVMLTAGLMINGALSVIDEWVASPMQQRALQIKNIANKQNTSGISLWARHGNEFVTVKSVDKNSQPVGIEIFRYRADRSLTSYIYAQRASTAADGSWLLHNVMQKSWKNNSETLRKSATMHWQSLFFVPNLKELTLPAGSFSVRQLNRYIGYLQRTGQPSAEYRIVLWKKLGQPILVLAMILLAIPFTFSNPRTPELGNRLAIGSIVGLFTYISYQIILNLGLLLSLNVPLTTLAPPTVLLIIALWQVYRFDRQY